MYFSLKDINEDLKMMLVERDDYYMQQDSLLVDIEDIIKWKKAFQVIKRGLKK